MNDLDRLMRVTGACAQEGVRRAFGDTPDPRYDIPLAMLLDLADEMGWNRALDASGEPLALVEDEPDLEYLDDEDGPRLHPGTALA